MVRMPSVFVSHGAPDLALHPSLAHSFLRQLGQTLGRPAGILVLSAHWLTLVPTVSRAVQMATIHDFGGFAPALYQFQYPAPGAPDLAERVQTLLNVQGVSTTSHLTRGLDHGAWSPLMLMYPQADIPVTQLAIQPRLSPTYHWQIGRALAPLRDAGILILGSGALTHNLSHFGTYPLDAPPVTWAQQFDDWVYEQLMDRQVQSLLDYGQLAPHAQHNHPSPEHLLPLFVALGAGGNDPEIKPLHRSFTYGVFSMASYSFS
ncbi:putative extradiol ring-cleavage dioxygenase [Gloeomargarita lithophora Alchichica-D10]|uniref:Putative extradiol ring-cleavage dioxygenase n=1 Tax=Gloeomargarita lithophora Alchichica-D10 TaxID=1188229 RepID=A0A1J0AFQ6_9CYAN|nr:class III extradiol ring-cleavage dioxygenase [Gloeomargarita lithophora]APB34774.1 putative extradiol ring-cleavage dioxygenase [Gloeomargarita lithophora Alchichica-D10]